MRYITLGGKQYPIRATMNVDAKFTARYNEVIAAAEEQAVEEAAQKELDEAKIERVRARRVKSAVKRYVNDVQNSLQQIADLINEAVAYEAVMNGVDISGKVPGYPMTAQKVGMIATAEDLNREETVQAVADEMMECRGGDQKNLTAGELMKIAKKILE